MKVIATTANKTVSNVKLVLNGPHMFQVEKKTIN